MTHWDDNGEDDGRVFGSPEDPAEEEQRQIRREARDDEAPLDSPDDPDGLDDTIETPRIERSGD